MERPTHSGVKKENMWVTPRDFQILDHPKLSTHRDAIATVLQ